MPHNVHPNRVQPDGNFLAIAARGGFMGNRGRLHDAGGVIRRRWQGKAWITCTLHDKPGRPSPGVLPPHGYTRLFFQDEAVACAAGHRPCAECRRDSYRRFQAAWARAFGRAPGHKTPARAMDAVLHAARTGPAPGPIAAETLPDGAFIRLDGVPHLIWQQMARPFHPAGYGAPVPCPPGQVALLTPLPLLAVMAAGWRPCLDPADDRPNW